MTAYIYLIRKDNTPVYVGFTTHLLADRWSKHKYDANAGSDTALHRAIRKYGEEPFLVECLYQSEDVDHTLNMMEHHYIWLYKTHISSGGYNLTFGGEGAPGNKASETTKKKMSVAHKGRVFSEEWKAKISNAKRGKPRSQETKKKISEAHSNLWKSRVITQDIKDQFSDMANERWFIHKTKPKP